MPLPHNRFWYSHRDSLPIVRLRALRARPFYFSEERTWFSPGRSTPCRCHMIALGIHTVTPFLSFAFARFARDPCTSLKRELIFPW